jgi:hypothetical protein
MPERRPFQPPARNGLPPLLARALMSRRELLARAGLGLGGLSLASLFNARAGAGEPDAAASAAPSPLSPHQPHFTGSAKRVIHIFPEGGPSHLDTFDPKPVLEKYHGRPVDEVIKEYTKQAGEAAAGMGRLSGKLQKSGFSFARHGECGAMVSELLPKLSGQVDELCIVRSMSTTSSVHEPAQLMMNTGALTVVRPSMGSWVVYGLGTENQNLPAFVALAPSGTTQSGDKHWSNAFLPGWTRGTAIATKNSAIEKLIEHLRSGSTSLREQRRQLDLLDDINQEHLAGHPGDALLDSRIAAFETAFRMQVEATDAFDLAREPMPVRTLYGDTEQGRQLLLARRLVERGVRYVQAWHTGWDTHDENDPKHRELCLAADQPLAALIQDLKQKDMLKDTLVLWAGEFGRTPTSDNNDVASKKGIGRDHNAGGFTVWMAGGGVKRGLTYGNTDDLGAVAVEDKMDVHDLHATILHLLGFDHERLTYRYAGRDYRLTDVEGTLVKGLLA